jgi:multicomponent Na+:H+ antiporter subunit C
MNGFFGLTYFFDRFNYYVIFFLFFAALFGVILKKDLIHKLIALSIFQTCAILIYLTIGYTKDAYYPILIDHHSSNILQNEREILYNNPLPHVLMLTAIVVGIATFALGLSIILAIAKSYNKTNMQVKSLL